MACFFSSFLVFRSAIYCFRTSISKRRVGNYGAIRSVRSFVCWENFSNPVASSIRMPKVLSIFSVCFFNYRIYLLRSWIICDSSAFSFNLALVMSMLQWRILNVSKEAFFMISVTLSAFLLLLDDFSAAKCVISLISPPSRGETRLEYSNFFYFCYFCY